VQLERRTTAPVLVAPGGSDALHHSLGGGRGPMPAMPVVPHLPHALAGLPTALGSAASYGGMPAPVLSPRSMAAQLGR
jgi:hypothetical protein